MRYVIIGNAAAAVGCLEGIRRVDPKGPITVVSSEPYHTYGRPLISYLLYGKTTESRMQYRPADFYEKNGCEALLGRTAVSIDAHEHTVTLDNGAQLAYDKLLVATGSRPFVPPMSGLDTVQNKHTFMTLDDAKGLEKTLTKQSRVLVVGAGLIGLKCVEGILDRCASVTVADLSDRILPSILDEDGAALVQRSLEEKGVRFLLSDSVKRFSAHTAQMNSGQSVAFDALVIAVGVRPNVELLEKAGGCVEKGIITDDTGLTSLPDVYAAGDCTESKDIASGQRRILALLPNAYLQGECAGQNMAGANVSYTNAIPLNAIGFFGLHLCTAGCYDGEAIVRRGPGRYKKLFVKDNLLKGYILIGEIERAGIYTAMIRDRVPLDSVDFELLCERPQLMAFSRQERAKQLGGVAR